MPNAGEILRNKGSKNTYQTIAPTATVREACHVMRDHHVDFVLVMHGATVDGLLTDVDVVNKVVAEDRDPARATVGEVMTRRVVVVGPERPLEEIEALIEQYHIRHVPVAGPDKLLGVIDVFDVVHYHADTHRQHAQMLSDYIYGRS